MREIINTMSVIMNAMRDIVYKILVQNGTKNPVRVERERTFTVLNVRHQDDEGDDRDQDGKQGAAEVDEIEELIECFLFALPIAEEAQEHPSDAEVEEQGPGARKERILCHKDDLKDEEEDGEHRKHQGRQREGVVLFQKSHRRLFLDRLLFFFDLRAAVRAFCRPVGDLFSAIIAKHGISPFFFYFTMPEASCQGLGKISRCVFFISVRAFKPLPV